MRDWLNTLRPASFRGVPFWVEIDGPDVGRRVSVQEISGGDIAVTEDMGQRARTVWVAAYVTGDLADVRALALEAACAAGGASMLTLPIDPARLMHCTACRRNRHRDRAGLVGYDLEFVEAGTGYGFGLGGMASLRNVFATGAAIAATSLASFF